MSKKITSFTLIELLVVIAIIAVLTGLSLVVMRKSKNVS
ncbi:MAG: prepilin-type N-terminal cleavage/methylation domain-containing protein, partial [Candidatus Berkelbacteria bacterium]|nr:prepilin-type N-terminal cleavage/methylation domain-containing protein [Candidatus Berkelbacteria bacterium]